MYILIDPNWIITLLVWQTVDIFWHQTQCNFLFNWLFKQIGEIYPRL